MCSTAFPCFPIWFLSEFCRVFEGFCQVFKRFSSASR